MQDHEIDAIRVEIERKRISECRLAKLRYESLPELSSEIYSGGEIQSFVERQLIPVHFGYGGWRELSQDDLRGKVLAYLRNDT